MELEKEWFKWLPKSRLVLGVLQATKLTHFCKKFCVEAIDNIALSLIGSEDLKLELRMSEPEQTRFFAAVAAIAHLNPLNDISHPLNLN